MVEAHLKYELNRYYFLLQIGIKEEIIIKDQKNVVLNRSYE